MEEPFPLSDPETLRTTLHQRGHPRLLWEPVDDERLRRSIGEDPAASQLHTYLMSLADAMVPLPLPKHELHGIRMLEISRCVLRRSTTLAYAWRMGGKDKHLHALCSLLDTVCRFNDWNPSHFLDTAEMAMGVALGLDWAHEALPQRIREQCEEALFNHAIGPSFIPELARQLPLQSNWNQVCNAGVLAAALVRDTDDATAAFAALQRMREWLPHILQTYGPDGVFPEGPGYWYYGTTYHVLLTSILESALGTDFGLTDFPGFMESADVVQQLTAPGGQYFNFGDCGDPPLLNEALLWFAWKTGTVRYRQTGAIEALAHVESSENSSIQRFAAIGLLWYARSRPTGLAPLPDFFAAGGTSPLAVMRSASLFLACKGGHAGRGHGHMDAGSFVLESSGIRWSCDPGNQPYEPLEAIMGGSLWDMRQNSSRWSLLSKNNFGHSTLSLDGALHSVEGKVPLLSAEVSRKKVTFDLKLLYAPQPDKAIREYHLLNENAVEITDLLYSAKEHRKACWQMMTQAEVVIADREAILEAGEHRLQLSVLQPRTVHIKVVYLDPPPLGHDIAIPDLKRIEIHFKIPAGIQTSLRVRLQKA